MFLFYLGFWSGLFFHQLLNLRLWLGLFRQFNFGFFGKVIEGNAFVEHHGLELGKGFVDQVLHHGIGGERYLGTAFYENPFACIHIHTLAVFHFNHLEGSQSFHLHQFLIVKAFVEDIHKGSQEALGLLLLYLMLLAQILRKVLNLSHFPLLS